MEKNKQMWNYALLSKFAKKVGGPAQFAIAIASLGAAIGAATGGKIGYHLGKKVENTQKNNEEQETNKESD